MARLLTALRKHCDPTREGAILSAFCYVRTFLPISLTVVSSPLMMSMVNALAERHTWHCAPAIPPMAGLSLPIQRKSMMTVNLSKRAAEIAALLTVCLVFVLSAHADEGMWTFDNSPQKQSEKSTASRRRRTGSITCGCPRCASPVAVPLRSFLPRDW